MRVCELIVLGYLAYVVVLAWSLPIAIRRRVIVTVVALATAAAIWATQHFPASRVRDWIPALYILLAYWLSGALFRSPMNGVEAWLSSWDAWLFDLAGFAAIRRAPRWLLESLELMYASVTPLIPLGFAAVTILSSRADADRYWAPVVGAELVCYAALPWIQTRPPRALGHGAAIDAHALTLRRLNRSILRHASIEVNTVPSGHVAGAFATAFAVYAQAPAASPIFFVLACGISAAAFIGRYHYAADCVLGLLVALAAAVLSR